MSPKQAFYSFNYLFNAAQAQKQRLDTSERPGIGHISALAMLAFSYEAFFNHLGEMIFDCWNGDLERLSPIAKLNLIFEVIGEKPDYGNRPFQSCKKVIGLRNKLAHGKTEYIDPENCDLNESSLPPSWQNKISEISTELAFEDFESIARELQNKLSTLNVPVSLVLSELVEKPEPKGSTHDE